MKPTVNTSMRSIQQNLRYQAYREGRGNEGMPQPDSPKPRDPAESATLPESGNTPPADESGNAAENR